MSAVLYAGRQILSFPNNRSSHPFWKLLFCTEGSGKIRFNRSEVIKYKKNFLVIIPPDRLHLNQSSEDFQGIVIDLADFPQDITTEPMAIEDEGVGHLRQLCELICYYYVSSNQNKEQMLSRYVDALNDTIRSLQAREDYSFVVREIENTILQNFHDCGFELDEQLRNYPFSYDYLRKLFKKEYGITPHRYLNDLRLNTAAEMLTKGYVGNANVAEVSRRCGFQEPLYFSRMFKKKYGLAPSYYENQNKEE